MTKSLSDYGIEVTYSKGLGITNDLEISRVKPNDIIKFIEKNREEIRYNSDICLISCTNFRAVEVISEITEILQMDIVTSNYSILKYLNYV